MPFVCNLQTCTGKGEKTMCGEDRRLQAEWDYKDKGRRLSKLEDDAAMRILRPLQTLNYLIYQENRQY